MLESIRDQVRQAQVLGRSLRLRGGDTKRFYGEPVRAEAELDMRPYAGIVSYEPTELVITARCGTPPAEFEALSSTHTWRRPTSSLYPAKGTDDHRQH